MNTQPASFDWNQVRAFLATAEAGSFSGAARTVSSTQPTISRQVAALEEALGVTLFERNARTMVLTQVGRELLDHVHAMSDAAALISMTALSHSQTLTGEVTVTATDLLSSAFLPGLLAPLRDTAPGVRIQVKASSAVQNLARHEADIAIRHARPDQPDLIARYVGDARATLYATSVYLDRVGRPKSPRDVADLAFVGTPDPERLIAPLHHQGIPLRPENFVVTCENNTVVWQMVKAGFGVGVLPNGLCEPEPGVEKVLPSLTPLSVPVWLATHRELRTNRRIRVVFDELARGLEALLKRY